jgi:hypothetical protein
MRKYLKWVLVNILILGLLAGGGWFYFTKQSSHNLAKVRFTQTHGGAVMTQFMNPRELYFATWETNKAIGMSLYVDGVWVVIGTQEKVKTNENP